MFSYKVGNKSLKSKNFEFLFISINMILYSIWTSENLTQKHHHKKLNFKKDMHRQRDRRRREKRVKEESERERERDKVVRNNLKR